MRWVSRLILLAALLGCDRNVEPFVPGEEPRRPDLRKIFPPGAEQAARSEAPPEMPPAPGARAGADASAAAPPIEGLVSVAPELAAQAERSGGVLFVIARPGPAGPPLAVLRIPSPRFPLRFSIGPEDRMIRTLPFAGELQLTARLDFDGDATSRSAGDLQGRAPGAYAPGARDVAIVLDEGL